MATTTKSQDTGALRSDRGTLRAAAVVLGALLIVGIPLTRLSDGNSTRFGWQMFSSGGAPTEYTVLNDAGESYEVKPADYVVLVRSNLPLAETLPAHLCSVEPGAVAVITRSEGTEVRIAC